MHTKIGGIGKMGEGWGRGNKKATDEQLIEKYEKLGSVWAVAQVFNMCGQSVHERLSRIGVIKTDFFTKEESEKIIKLYSDGFISGDGKLESLSMELNRSKQNVCRYARKLGLTISNRKRSKELCDKFRVIKKEWHKNNEHPRGALGMKHSESARKRIGDGNRASWAGKTEEEKNTRIISRMKSQESKGVLYRVRLKTTWKQGWREIGGVRQYYRSRWEANYARYLEWLKNEKKIIKWEHEPQTFWFEKVLRGARSYLPDFRVTLSDGSIEYHEVKGWMDDRSQTKLKRMAKYYPEVKLILIDAKRYRAIESTLKHILDFE